MKGDECSSSIREEQWAGALPGMPGTKFGALGLSSPNPGLSCSVISSFLRVRTVASLPFFKLFSVTL